MVHTGWGLLNSVYYMCTMYTSHKLTKIGGAYVHACAKRVHGCLHSDSSYVHLQKHEGTVSLKPCVHGRVRCVQNVHGFIESIHQSEIFFIFPIS